MNKQGHSWDSFFTAEMLKKPTTVQGCSPSGRGTKASGGFQPILGSSMFCNKNVKKTPSSKGDIFVETMASRLIMTVRYFWDNVGACHILVLVQLFEFQILDLNGGNPAV